MELAVQDFNLKHTLECGQLFRFERRGDWYFVTARDRLFVVRQPHEKVVEFRGNIDATFMTHFFRLNVDYSDIVRSIARDKEIATALQAFWGLRLIRQDPWECLASYIVSQHANIAKIKRNLDALAACHGARLELDNYESWSFPGPEQLKNRGALIRCKLGFRADYLYETAQHTNEAWLAFLASLPYQEAKAQLMSLPGVGPKIADCVLLFSLGFDEAFPVDVWIKRVMQELYFEGREVANEKIVEFGQSYFGNYAGWAQQFLYAWARQRAKK